MYIAIDTRHRLCGKRTKPIPSITEDNILDIRQKSTAVFEGNN